MANLFRVAVAYTTSSLSIEASKGEKCLRCWRHASRYICFFPLSASYKEFSGVFAEWDLSSVFMTRMSGTLSVPFFQRSRISWCSLCYLDSGGGAPSRSVGPLVPAGLAFSLFTSQPANMRGSLRMCEGVKDFPARSATPSRSSL